MLNLDTHILLHALTDTLTQRERERLEAETWSISPIVFWEIAKLKQLGRIEIGVNNPKLMYVREKLHIWPLTIEICRASTELDFRSDPADELIAATSIVHGVPLMTRDAKIRRSKQVPLLDVS